LESQGADAMNGPLVKRAHKPLRFTHQTTTFFPLNHLFHTMKVIKDTKQHTHKPVRMRAVVEAVLAGLRVKAAIVLECVADSAGRGPKCKAVRSDIRSNCASKNVLLAFIVQLHGQLTVGSVFADSAAGLSRSVKT
jgi:hypothetical protein